MLLQSLLRPVLTPLMRGMFDPSMGSPAWSPLALWPDGIATPGMWISPRDLTSQWADYTGTTPVSVPGTVADSANPVGLALDIRAGAPEVLGPEVLTTPFDIAAAWTHVSGLTYSCNGTGYLQFTGAEVGKLYQIECVASGVTAGSLLTILNHAWDEVANANGTTTLRLLAVNGLSFYAASFTGTVTLSAKEVPGNHMLQSTSAARPLLSARVNLLQYTEDFGNASWDRSGCTVTTNSTTAPDGTNTADSIVTAGGTPNIYQTSAALPATECTFSIYVKGVGNSVGKALTLMVWYIGTATGTNTFSGVTISGDWQRVEIKSTPATAGTVNFRLLDIGNGALVDGDVVYVWGAQVVIGSNVGTYVPVPGAPYPSTGLPIAQLYDGVDDGMATAAFSAGTLIDGMDCLIAVRRDSAAATTLGLNDRVLLSVFGWCAPSESTVSCWDCGTPTVWVDGVQLAGGTSVQQGTLASAVTVGDWHIVEYRNLNLSAWSGAKLGLSYAGYETKGPIGDIMLYPSTASTTDKDAARQWLADYYGVTLP